MMSRWRVWAFGVGLLTIACGDSGGGESAGGAGGSSGAAGAGASGGTGGGAGLGGAAGSAGGAGAAGTAGTGGAPPPDTCNGKAEYCDRPFNQVSVVCTHNAMSSADAAGFDIPTPNQQVGIPQQLDDGVRCLMLDTYAWQEEIHLCHANCLLGATPWVPMLQQLRTWMDAHPGEVVTFILEANITEAETEATLRAGNMWDLVYHHDAPAGSPWPTLGQMVASGQRLVVFTDDGAANGQWHLDWTEYGWETPYNDPTFTCDDGRGDPTAYDNQIFILNHYTLCNVGGCPENGVTNNAYDFMLPRAQGCWAQDAQNNPWRQIPTFVNLDHYDVPTAGGPTARADGFDVVDALNAAWVASP